MFPAAAGSKVSIPYVQNNGLFSSLRAEYLHRDLVESKNQGIFKNVFIEFYIQLCILIILRYIFKKKHGNTNKTSQEQQ